MGLAMYYADSSSATALGYHSEAPASGAKEMDD
jgi:hypothetical protein